MLKPMETNTYQWLTIAKMNYCLIKAKKALEDEAVKLCESKAKNNPKAMQTF